MIKRIRNIKQVGVFSNLHNGNQHEFNKLTFIYGLNTHGKSTLCDIFRSLTNDDVSIIQKRKSIPGDNSTQTISLSILDEDNLPKEKNLDFKNNKWDKNYITSNIEIFDSKFIHDNVFTGLVIERNNKENFTDFILGEESVRIANQLEIDKKEIADKKKELKKNIPLYVTDKNEKQIEDFINLKIEKSLVELKEVLFDKQKKLKDFQDNDKNAANIISMNEPKLLEELSNTTLNSIKETNELLERSYDSLKDYAVQKLQIHISSNLNGSPDAEQWIKKGLFFNEIHIESSCPFCGQNLLKAEDLIKAYQSYFNDEYINYMSKINDEIDLLQENINPVFNLSSELIKILFVSKEYKDKMKEANFDQQISNIELYLNDLEETEINLLNSINVIKSQLKASIEIKKKSPFKALIKVNISNFEIYLKDYSSKIEEINRVIKIVKASILRFKGLYQSGTIKEEIQKLSISLNDIEKAICRIEQDKQCINYSTLVKEISTLQENYTKSSEDLEKSQNDYLNKYFLIINKIYNKLGSGDFTIEKGQPDNKGYKKIFGLVVKYKNKLIKEVDFPFVFSESDRRALAISIFWAKISVKEQDEKKNTILLLDDLVTSFDDNRITIACNLIIDTLDTVSQIIIVSHYSNFVKRFNEICKRNDTTYLHIFKDANTSQIGKLDLNSFVLSENQKNYIKINKFIRNEHSDDVRSSLRPFMEGHLKTTFYKSIVENNLSECMLNDLINKLSDLLIIDDYTKTTLHRFRDTLNPDSHIYTSNNSEDVRAFSKELVNYLYSIKFENEMLV